jgi:arylsulfatase A-like enzyme/Tfp pilus assembly protein PilF
MAPFAQAVAAPVRAAPKIRPNVILITIDTVRADHLGCYGAKDIQTPTLDGLARDGTVFERAISQVPLTWPSHAVILTGLYPFQNGVQNFTGQPLEARFRSVAQSFKQQGYATGAVVSAFVLDRSWGLARGFDFYDDAFAPEAFVNRDLGLVDRRAGESVTRALAWLKKNQRRPFFFWLHLYDPHSPYDPPEPYRTQYRGHLYDGEIAYADHELGRLIAWLKQTQLYNQTLIVFLSDHGESLGEHGEREHGFFVYNTTVHIPLIVKPAAGSGFRPARVSRAVETTAVAPTLVGLAKINDNIEKQFQSPALLGRGANDVDEAYSETFYPFSSFGWSPLHALETSHYQYIDAPEAELYDLVADPEEKHNIASDQPATAAVFKDKLRARLREKPFTPAGSENSKLSPDAAEKLRVLGYVAYRSPVSAEALASGLPDPKSKLWEFNAILEAEDKLRAGDVVGGKSLLLQVREEDSQMYIVPFVLGEAALKQNQWDEASAELRKCLDLNPHFDQAMLGLARALIFQGKLDEAKQWAQSAIRFNPENYPAWYQLGFIESRTDKQAAIVDYEKVVSLQENFAPVRRDLGMLYYAQRNYLQAAKHLAKAAELGIKEAPLFNFLGSSYSQTNQPMKAIRSYEEALRLDPNFAEAHLNLGYAFEQLKRKDAAGREYRRACELKKDFCELIRSRKKRNLTQGREPWLIRRPHFCLGYTFQALQELFGPGRKGVVRKSADEVVQLRHGLLSPSLLQKQVYQLQTWLRHCRIEFDGVAERDLRLRQLAFANAQCSQQKLS